VADQKLMLAFEANFRWRKDAFSYFGTGRIIDLRGTEKELVRSDS
jgi:hypothetical protein